MEVIRKLLSVDWAQVLVLSFAGHLGKLTHLSLSFPINKMAITILALKASGGAPGVTPGHTESTN